MSAASISAALRVFTKIKHDLRAFITLFMAFTCANTAGSTPNSFADNTSFFVLPGLKTAIFIAFVETVFTTRISLCREKNFATSSGLPTVADKHIRWKSSASTAIRSNAIASCAPRLQLANSCTSSNITCRTDFRLSRSRLPSKIACTVSGVVIRTSGGFNACCRLLYAVVSPCLTSMLMPSAAPHLSNRRSMSRFKARNGVI
ncbi:MAG: hypothetical protein C5S38_02465 [Candidatus Methanophagaceae archaeon]|nr:MAG: hypothetical protein C5S38_02465 [Methanophagales archaeon]